MQITVDGLPPLHVSGRLVTEGLADAPGDLVLIGMDTTVEVPARVASVSFKVDHQEKGMGSSVDGISVFEHGWPGSSVDSSAR
ncbi:hypothetical protein [Saccharopolyspora flava]|uniref:hypothetical protein n=1 Tax=Saccharopolyspora flava TaxID=95161 RepID=UPI000B88ED6B|nr:hypothetical protein [Saccharopolyspora flava]